MQSEDLMQDVVAIFQRHHPEWLVVSLNDMTVGIGEMKISLYNLALTVQDMNDDERGKTIVDFVENIAKTQSKPDAGDLPYATIKGRLSPQIIPDTFKETAPSLLQRPFCSGLSIAYALGGGGSYELLQQSVLAEWGVSQDEIEAQAIANLEVYSRSQTLQAKQRECGSFIVVAADDSYSAARLVLPRFMARLREALKAPRVFVGIPDRDFLIAWTPDFSEREAFAEKIRQDTRTEPYPLTDALFASSESGLVLLSLDEMRDHGREG